MQPNFAFMQPNSASEGRIRPFDVRVGLHVQTGHSDGRFCTLVMSSCMTAVAPASLGSGQPGRVRAVDTNTAAPPITADDDQLRAALAEADLPPLLPSLAYTTGDLSLLRPELRIDPLLMREEQAGLTPDQQAAIRDLAFDTLRGLRDGTRTVKPVADRVGLQRIIEFIAGSPVAPEYLPLLEDLSVQGY